MGKVLDKKTRIKAWILLISVIIAMLIPMRIQYKDGGTIDYKAMLYTVTKHHALTVEDYHTGYRTGTTVRILFWNVYENTEFVPDDINTVLSPADPS